MTEEKNPSAPESEEEKFPRFPAMPQEKRAMLERLLTSLEADGGDFAGSTDYGPDEMGALLEKIKAARSFNADRDAETRIYERFVRCAGGALKRVMSDRNRIKRRADEAKKAVDSLMQKDEDLDRVFDLNEPADPEEASSGSEQGARSTSEAPSSSPEPGEGQGNNGEENDVPAPHSPVELR